MQIAEEGVRVLSTSGNGEVFVSFRGLDTWRVHFNGTVVAFDFNLTINTIEGNEVTFNPVEDGETICAFQRADGGMRALHVMGVPNEGSYVHSLDYPEITSTFLGPISGGVSLQGDCSVTENGELYALAAGDSAVWLRGEGDSEFTLFRDVGLGDSRIHQKGFVARPFVGVAGAEGLFVDLDENGRIQTRPLPEGTVGSAVSETGQIQFYRLIDGTLFHSSE